MVFDFVTNHRPINRWDGSNFIEETLAISGADGITVTQDASGFLVSGNQAALSGALQTDINSRVLRAGDTMTGFLTLNADPVNSGHAATKQYVDSVVGSGIMYSDDDGVTVVSGVHRFDFLHALDVTLSGSDIARVTVDESEFTSVVFLTGNQSIAGTKTFTSPIVTASGAEPTTTGDTGAEGTIRWSDDFLYVAVATDTWKRIPLALW